MQNYVLSKSRPPKCMTTSGAGWETHLVWGYFQFPENMKTGGQLVVPVVAIKMGTFLGAHREARTAV